MAVVLPAMTSAVFPCLSSLAGGAQALPYSEWAVFWRHRSHLKCFCCFSTFHILIFLPNVMSFKMSGSRSQLEAASCLAETLVCCGQCRTLGHSASIKKVSQLRLAWARGYLVLQPCAWEAWLRAGRQMWSGLGFSTWSCRVRRAQPLLSVCLLRSLQLGFC